MISSKQTVWGVVLLGSIALNVFIGGFFAGQWLNRPKDMPSAVTPSVNTVEVNTGVVDRTARDTSSGNAGDTTAAVEGAPGRANILGYANPRLFFRMLPPEYRREAQRTVGWRLQGIQRMGVELRQDRVKLMTLLTDETVDRKTLEEAFKRSRALDMAFLEEMHAILTELALILPPEERTALRQAVQRRLERQQGRWERWRERRRQWQEEQW